MVKKSPFVYIDLFAGCGGLSLGLKKTGWKGLFAVEKSKDAFLTLKHNLIAKGQYRWPKWLSVKNQSINSVIRKYKKNLIQLKGKVTLVAGGPPCQGFSTAGRRQEADHRNSLVKSYIQFIKLVRPNVLFFENVRGFTWKFEKRKSKGISYSDYVCEKLRKIGYDIHGQILNFGDYGIPQRRNRFILVGVYGGDAKSFFDQIKKESSVYLKSKGLQNRSTVIDAIGDLLKSNGTLPSSDTKGFEAGKYGKSKGPLQKKLRPKSINKNTAPDSHRFVNHTKDVVSKFNYILKHAPKDKQIGSKIKKKFGMKKRVVVPLDANSMSPTLTSLPDDCIHFSEPRVLTVREYARIQTFPDSFHFKGKYTTGNTLRRKEVPRYTQIGNAIPPLFGEQVGRALKRIVKNVKN